MKLFKVACQHRIRVWGTVSTAINKAFDFCCRRYKVREMGVEIQYDGYQILAVSPLEWDEKVSDISFKTLQTYQKQRKAYKVFKVIIRRLIFHNMVNIRNGPSCKHERYVNLSSVRYCEKCTDGERWLNIFLFDLYKVN